MQPTNKNPNDKADNEFYQDLVRLVNKHSQENRSGTPDYIIADFLMHCLKGFHRAINFRENWYGREQDERFGTPAKGLLPDNGV